MNLLNLLGNMVYLLDCLSFLMRNILYLRIIAIMASISSATYFYLQPTPIWLNVGWNFLYILANSFQIGTLLKDKRPIKFKEENDKWLYYHNFKVLSPGQFLKIANMKEEFSLQPGEVLISQGEAANYLYVIYSGTVAVEVHGNVVAYCRSADFLGEMSLISGELPSATARAIDTVQGFRWHYDLLRQVMLKDDKLANALSYIFGKKLVSKLRSSK